MMFSCTSTQPSLPRVLPAFTSSTPSDVHCLLIDGQCSPVPGQSPSPSEDISALALIQLSNTQLDTVLPLLILLSLAYLPMILRLFTQWSRWLMLSPFRMYTDHHTFIHLPLYILHGTSFHYFQVSDPVPCSDPLEFLFSELHQLKNQMMDLLVAIQRYSCNVVLQ